MTVATTGSLGKKAAKLQMASGILDIFKLDPLVGATVARVNKVGFCLFIVLCSVISFIIV